MKELTLEGLILKRLNFKELNFKELNLKRLLLGTKLEGAYGVSLDQFSKLKKLYDTKLDEELLIPLKEKYPTLFEVPEYYE
ncbi:MAG: hypothetical protein NHB15_06405 [Methanosarcina barkeri]|nr:hypothetical protein [Methanosarcina sp. ERenArc_MAG2]